MRPHHVALSVDNIEDSISFYSKHFGFKLKNRYRKEEIGASFCYMELKGFEIEIFAFDELKDNKDDLSELGIRGIRHLAFSVEDIHSESTRLSKEGLLLTQVKKGASGNLFCFTSDPSGIQLELIQILD